MSLLKLTKPGLFAATLFLYLFFPASPAEAAQLRGTVGSGQANVEVTLFEATQEEPIEIGRGTTDDSGEFEIDSPNDQSESIFFVTANLGPGVELVTILGPELPSETTINELTTVAATYSMAQFYRKGYISGNSFGLRIAASMNNNIVTPLTGESSDVLLTSPNADETNSLRMTRSLANLLGACSNNAVVRWFFFFLTRTADDSIPQNTAEAMANLAREPGNNADLIYLLSKLHHSYSPALIRKPDGWTVTVKVNDSGDDSSLFGGPANVAFDSRGYAWIPNNVVQGTPNSSNTVIVLQPDGKPATGGQGLPTSPVTGGGILGAGWGITIDHLENIWVGNFGWGSPKPEDGNRPTPEPPGNGSVSVVLPDGTPISVPEGLYGGTYRVQALKEDQQGNIWLASFGNNRVVVFPDGDPLNSFYFDLDSGDRPFGVAIDAQGAGWITNSGGLSGLNQSSVAKFIIEDGQLKLVFKRDVGHTLKVIDIDSQGNAWFASQGESKIYAMKPNGILFDRNGFTGGGVYGPWGITVDGEDNIWVSNFGPTSPSVLRRGRISKFAGINPPPGKKTGDPLTPKTGFTVPSGGSQVLLHDGTPLNGDPGLPSFTPLMRQTSLQIDQAGNIWTVNNWKPRFSTDVVGFDDGDIRPAGGNPGGDGVVIFVGLAPPRQM